MSNQKKKKKKKNNKKQTEGEKEVSFKHTKGYGQSAVASLVVQDTAPVNASGGKTNGERPQQSVRMDGQRKASGVRVLQHQAENSSTHNHGKNSLYSLYSSENSVEDSRDRCTYLGNRPRSDTVW